jgi:hypothetical protein
MASKNGGIAGWTNGKQYRQAVGMLFWSTIAINGFTNTFTQSVRVALTITS